MTQDELIIEADAYLQTIKRKLFAVIDELPYEEGVFDDRHIHKALMIIIEFDPSSTEEIIKKIKIWDHTGNKWEPDKEQGKLELTQDKIDFNERVEDENRH